MASVQRLIVQGLSPASQRGWLLADGLCLPCALGRGGRRARKREGDGATPIGRWTVDQVLYRADRVQRPRTCLPLRRIGRDDGWCDAPLDRNYNRPVRLPYPASTEGLHRQDGVYDIIVVLGHNRRPRIRGHGSAIFMHLARPGLAPTAGCIALERAALIRLLARLRPRAVVVVEP